MSGSPVTFTVRLNGKPTDTVKVPLSSSDVGEGTVSPAMLTFGPADWDVALRGADKLAATLRERWEEATLFRKLATLRTDTPKITVDELKYRGPTPRFAHKPLWLFIGSLDAPAANGHVKLHITNGNLRSLRAMLGQPVSMLIPRVVGFKLNGDLPAGATATDLVLTITEMLRKHGVVGKFVEFYGPGVSALPLAVDGKSDGSSAVDSVAPTGLARPQSTTRVSPCLPTMMLPGLSFMRKA